MFGFFASRVEHALSRICVITGATSGLGRATALALAGMGADLMLVGRNQPLGEHAAHLCRRRNPGGRTKFLRADLSSQTDVRALAAEIAGIASALTC